jgi:hypothetical protein
VTDACYHGCPSYFQKIATGFFASPVRLVQAYGHSDHAGLFYSGANGGADATLLGAQIVGVLFIITWTGGTMLPFFFGLERTGHFRADAIAEVTGLDKAYFGGLQLGGGEEDVAPEQIEKLSKQIERNLHHRKRHHSDKGSASASSKCTTSGSVVSIEVPKDCDSEDQDDNMGNAKNV